MKTFRAVMQHIYHLYDTESIGFKMWRKSCQAAINFFSSDLPVTEEDPLEMAKIFVQVAQK